MKGILLSSYECQKMLVIWYSLQKIINQLLKYTVQSSQRETVHNMSMEKNLNVWFFRWSTFSFYSLKYSWFSLQFVFRLLPCTVSTAIIQPYFKVSQIRGEGRSPPNKRQHYSTWITVHGKWMKHWKHTQLCCKLVSFPFLIQTDLLHSTSMWMEIAGLLYWYNSHTDSGSFGFSCSLFIEMCCSLLQSLKTYW